LKLAGILDPIARTVWSAAFASIGRAAYSRGALPIPFGGQSILVIAPHPDDETLGCAGTILMHVRSGDAVCLAFVTDGAQSRAGGLAPEIMRQHRQREAEAAAASMRVARFEWFGLPEGRWSCEELSDPLLDVLRRTSPHVIYVPSRVDFHPEHHKVAHCLARLIAGPGIIPADTGVRVYPLQVPLTPLLGNRIVDCSSVWAGVLAAMSVYATQSANVGRALRMRRYAALSHGLTRYGEEFWQMSASSYSRLHGAPPHQWRTTCFRGIRYRSFSDPLAYLSGIRERRRLKRSAEDSGRTLQEG